MKDIPIIFSAPMVRALIENRKKMTRRLAWKVEPVFSEGGVIYEGGGGQMDYVEPHDVIEGKPSPWQRVKPGDRLWVRETWQQEDEGTLYRATWPTEGATILNWRSPIHMPRSLSRLTLIVTATKIERLQEISEEDAIAEGAYRRPDGYWTLTGALAAGGPEPAKYAFRMLWSDLHGNESWDANPEVVAISSRVVKSNIDAPEAKAA